MTDIIFILGMHRSGTSALAGALRLSGCTLGDNLIPPSSDNVKGFFEHKLPIEVHDKLLAGLHTDWRDIQALPKNWRNSLAYQQAREQIEDFINQIDAYSSPFLVKDPRISILFPLWQDVTDFLQINVKVLLCIRHPKAVAFSLARRDGISITYALGLWLRYILDAEIYSASNTRATVFFPDFLATWNAVYPALQNDFHLPSLTRAQKRSITNFFDVNIVHETPAHDIDILHPIYQTCLSVFEYLTNHPGHALPDSLKDTAIQALHELRRDLAISAEYAQVLGKAFKTEQDHRVFLEQQLQNYQGRQEIYAAQVSDLSGQVEALEANLQQAHNDAAQAQQETRQAQSDAAQAQQETRRAREIADSLYSQLQWANQELGHVISSNSWKVTHPLRLLGTLSRKSISRLTPARAKAVTQSISATPSVPARSQPRPLRFPPACTSERNGLRLLIVSLDIVGPIRNGGIGTAFSALALFAARCGHQCSILYTLGMHTENWSISDSIEFYSRGGVNFVPLPNQERPYIDAPWPRRNSYRIYQWLQHRTNDYDLVIFPDWRGEAYYTLLAKNQGLLFHNTEIWINTHGPSTWSMEGNYQLPDSIENIELDFLERESVRMADGLISPSAYLYTWMERHHWDLPKRKKVIQNLMWEDPTNSHDVSIFRKQVRIEELVFFGRLEPRKGLVLFCEAIDLLFLKERPRISKITFLGKDLPAHVFDSFAFIYQRSKSWGIEIRIETDFDRDQALHYLTASDKRLAIIPSLVENLPYTVLECLHHGVHFITTNVGGIPELVKEDDWEICISPPRPSALAKLIGKHLQEDFGHVQPAVTTRQSEQLWSDWLLEAQTRICTTKGSAALPIGRRPKVSVCIPHFDSLDTLTSALQSLDAQSYPEFEVIVVDDGSRRPATKSHLPQLRTQLQSKGWMLIEQENGYPGAARNRAAMTATGEYLLFMDDDNLAMEEEIETFVRVAERTHADVLTTVSAVFSGQTPPPSPEHLWLPLGPDLGMGVLQNVFGDTNSFWRTQRFLQLGGFATDYGIGHEDWEIFARAVLRGYHMALIPKPLFWYRATTTGIQGSANYLDYHALNIRPYIEENPGGLGLLAAFSLSSKLTEQPARKPIINLTPKTSSRMRRYLRIFLQPELRAKFHLHRKRYGWRRTLKNAWLHMQRNI